MGSSPIKISSDGSPNEDSAFTQRVVCIPSMLYTPLPPMMPNMFHSSVISIQIMRYALHVGLKPDLQRRKIREEGWMQGARNAETGMYTKYMRISSTAQRRITSHLAAVFWQPSGMASSSIRRPPQQFLNHNRHARRQRAHQFITYGSRRARHFLDRHALAP